MKILEVLPYFYPAWAYGGPVYFVYEIAKRLAKKGHWVTVFASDVKDGEKRLGKRTDVPLKIGGFTTYYFRNLSNWAAWNWRLFFSPKILTTGVRILPFFDLIHFHDFFIWQNFYLAKVAKKNKIPVILSANSQFDPVRLNEKKLVKKIYFRLVGNKFLKIIDHFIAVTEFEKQDYIKLGIDSDKITVIPTGIEINGGFKKEELAKFRKKYNICPYTQVILFLSRIHKIKGVDLLIKAYKIIKEKYGQKTKLLVVGPDNDNLVLKLRNLATCLKLGDSIIFAGCLTGKDKVLAFKTAAVYVLPSFSEGLPSSVLEACCLGLPVAISADCHIPQVAEYEAGLIFKNNKKDIAEKIIKILDKGKEVDFGKNGQKMVREVFSWNKIIDRLEKFYQVQARKI